MKGVFIVARSHKGGIEVKQVAVMDTDATSTSLVYSQLRAHRGGNIDLPTHPEKSGEKHFAIRGNLDEKTASRIKQGNYEQDADGNWHHVKTGQEVGHDEECDETYQALGALFEVFSEIKID